MLVFSKNNKKVKQAVALEYDPADNAPKVIAMGKGALAEKIIINASTNEISFFILFHLKIKKSPC